jgi:leader peptidase (prepilin peptidase)/N-methyltransferase
MLAWEIVCAAGLGLILGSFLNALLFRFNTGKSVMRGRSACMRCGHELSGLDLIPVASYLFLRGRCRYCGSRVSAQYPLVEAAAGLIAALIYLKVGASAWFVYWFLVWMTLLFVLVYDLRHMVIPWSASLLLMALGLLHAYAFGTWWGIALGVPLLLISLISRGTWMGWGDGFLELSLGALLGVSMGLTALMIAFWIGGAVGVVLLILAKNRYTMRSEVAFAPFLVLGAGLAYFLNVDLFSSLPLLF